MRISSTQHFSLILEDLHATAFEKVVEHYTTTRKPGRYASFPSWRMDKDLVDGINRVLNFLKPTDEPQQKKLHADAAAATHPALTDPVWLDATFLVGPDKTELKANRACLATMNPVMKNMLYGTGFIVVDPMKAIE